MGTRQLSDPVFRFGRRVGHLSEEFEQAVALGVPGAFFEERGRGFHDTHLFGDGYGDPLVQGDAVFFGEALSGLFHGMGKLQWVSSPAHGFTFFISCAGVSTGMPKRSAATEKSAVL